MPSPLFRINGAAPGAKVAVAAGGAVHAELDDLSGVDVADWSIITTDETTSPAGYALATSGPKNSIADTTAAGPGTAGILLCRINGGINKATQAPDPANTIATAKFYVPTTQGYEVICAGEGRESDAQYGYTGIINAPIRGQATAAEVAAVPKAARMSGFASVMSTAQGSATPLIVGALYYERDFLPDGGIVRFRAILASGSMGGTCYLGLYDVAGVTTGGVPGYVPGGILSTNSLAGILVEATLALATIPSALFLLALWVDPVDPANTAICAGAWIDVLPP